MNDGANEKSDEVGEEPRFLSLNVSGKDAGLWISLREKLIAAIQGLLDQVVDQSTGETVTEAGQALLASAVDSLKATLKKRGIENSEIEARVLQIYAVREKTLAEARKIDAEAEQIRLTSSIEKLKIALMAHRAFLVGEKGEEAVVFAEQADEFLKSLVELTETKET